MRKRTWTAGIAALMLLLMCCTPALALDESEVESAIAASSNEAVAGNIFIWFLCAVAFLKISQKIDSFLAALGINVGRTGGSMLGELLIAGRAVGSAVGGLGGAVGYIIDHDYYRMMHPLYPAPQPKPAPVKGTKRYRKAQAREKRKAKKAAVWNVLSIIDSLSAQNQTRTVV